MVGTLKKDKNVAVSVHGFSTRLHGRVFGIDHWSFLPWKLRSEKINERNLSKKRKTKNNDSKQKPIIPFNHASILQTLIQHACWTYPPPKKKKQHQHQLCLNTTCYCPISSPEKHRLKKRTQETVVGWCFLMYREWKSRVHSLILYIRAKKKTICTSTSWINFLTTLWKKWKSDKQEWCSIKCLKWIVP